MNRRLSRIILYWKNQGNFDDRCTVLQKCVEEISQIREHEKHENCKLRFLRFLIFEILKLIWIVSVPKIILLYGGDMDNVKAIYRLMSIQDEQKQFGVVIIRVD